MRKQKSNNKRLSNYKNPNDDDFFASSALIRNGDYALGKDNWQKVQLEYKYKSSSPMIAISSSSLSSDKDMNVGEEDKYISSTSNWNNEDTGFVKRLLSSKRK